MSESNMAPYTADELMQKAAIEAARLNIPEIWRDDAIQEFVMAALEAVERAKSNIRGYQFIRGRGAMIDFWRKEIQHERAVPLGCSEHATRLSFDMPVEGMDGEETTLADVIPDENAIIPGEEPSRRLSGQEIRKALDTLTPEEREVAIRIFVHGESQEDVATEMGKTRHQIRWLLETARKRIEPVWGKEIP